MNRRMLAAVMAAGMMTAALTGCGSSSTTSSNADASAAGSASTASDDLSGSITLAGSTSMEKLCEAMSESFMQEYPGITVSVEYTGSGAGLESLASGSVDIGDASRSLTDDEKNNGAVENVVALDGIAVITEKSNTLTDVSSQDLSKIYSGEIQNWKDLGGADENIVVIGREAGSGTRDAFEELLNVKDSCKYAQELDSTGAVLAKVASTPGAVGYVSLDVVDDSVNAVSIDGVEPTEEKILEGNYMLSRPFVMATKGDISEQNALVQKWFEYISSDAGKDVISKVGLINPN